MSDGKLKALDVASAVKLGKHPDGSGLYLQVLGADSKSWLYRYWIGGKERWDGLGSFKTSAYLKLDRRGTSHAER